MAPARKSGAEARDNSERPAGVTEEASPRSADEREGVTTRWAEGYATLASMPAPDGFSSERWARIITATGKFLDRWASEAIRYEWSDLDVFGVNPDAPGRRFDAMGVVLLLDRCEVVSIDEGGADLVANGGARLRYRRRPVPADTVSLWALTSALNRDDRG